MTSFPKGTRVRLDHFDHVRRPIEGGTQYPGPVNVGSIGTITNGTPDQDGDVQVEWDEVDSTMSWYIHHTEIVLLHPMPTDPDEIERWLTT